MNASRLIDPGGVMKLQRMDMNLLLAFDAFLTRPEYLAPLLINAGNGAGRCFVGICSMGMVFSMGLSEFVV